ncbi:MAG: DNA polymerase III subunit delta' [Pseudomonadota bacterium]
MAKQHRDTAWPLVGHRDAEAAFFDAHTRGRLHHAWLLEGPSGIGKAQLARRLAGFLLGAKGSPDVGDPSASGGSPFDAPADDPVVQLMGSGGHPDLRWITRTPDDKGKLPQDIKVDQVRSLIQFFTLAPAMGGWRVGVIDALDALNRSGANAVLKTLEEPPAQAILFLIYHGTSPILPTVRSRCRRLYLRPLAQDDAEAVIAGTGEQDPKTIAALAPGRPGLALLRATPKARSAVACAGAVLKGLPRLSPATINDAAQQAAASDEAFDAFSGRLLMGLARRAEKTPAEAARWLWMSRTLAEAREDKMDKAQTAAKLLAGLQKPAAAY